MIKKVFVGVLLAAVFILLVLGAVNRTLAKVNDQTPLSLQEKTLENKNEKKNINQSLQLEKNTSRSNNASLSNESEQRRRGSGVNGSNNDGQGNDSDRLYENSIRGDGVSLDAWNDLSGVLDEMGSDLWLITLSDGSQIKIEGRPLSYLIEQGFSASLGDQIAIRGFYEDGEFKVGHIVNQDTGQETELRNEAGQPLWSGNGWKNN